MIRSTSVTNPAAWALLLGLFFASQAFACADQTPTTVADLISLDAAEHQRVLRDGMTEGRLLYVKTEQYQSEPSGSLPGHFETEMWLGADPDGTITTAVSTLHYPDGPVTMDMTATYGHMTLAAWVDQPWQTPEFAERSGAEFKGRGELHGWESLIYEWSTDTQVQRLEIVEDAPLITRESTFAIDVQGTLTLTKSNTALKYQLLPPGAEAPPVDY